MQERHYQSINPSTNQCIHQLLHRSLKCQSIYCLLGTIITSINPATAPSIPQSPKTSVDLSINRFHNHFNQLAFGRLYPQADGVSLCRRSSTTHAKPASCDTEIALLHVLLGADGARHYLPVDVRWTGQGATRCHAVHEVATIIQFSACPFSVLRTSVHAQELRRRRVAGVGGHDVSGVLGGPALGAGLGPGDHDRGGVGHPANDTRDVGVGVSRDEPLSAVHVRVFAANEQYDYGSFLLSVCKYVLHNISCVKSVEPKLVSTYRKLSN